MKIIFSLAALFSFFAASPPDSAWQTLNQLKFSIKHDVDLDDVIFTPKPNQSIKQLVGKEIVIDGYEAEIWSIGGDKSAPNAILFCQYEQKGFSCCSHIGAESYVELLPKEKINLEKGKKYLFKGKLVLNTEDHLRLPYLLENAECLNCSELESEK